MRTPFTAALLTVLISFSVFCSDAATVLGKDAAEPTSVSVFGKGEMKVPAAFTPTKPASSIIDHEFKVGQGDSTARLTMMAAGGGVELNIKRWKGQFSGGDKAAQKTEKLTVGKWEIHLVDLSGSFSERMGGGPIAGGKMVQRENYAMAGAILVAPSERLYFAKMFGPAAVVKANRERFVEMVKSVGE
jgi:hypothetical protein